MVEVKEMKTIARISTDFSTKFGIPRQSGVVRALRGRIVFEEEYRNPDAVRGLDGFSHIWLIWRFRENKNGTWSPTVRPPRLGGNQRIGVFASRSPNRPNPIGLSCVRLERVEMHKAYGPVLHVLGADLMDGTEILDIKPYIPYADAHLEATGGFAEHSPGADLTVEISDVLLAKIPADRQDALLQVLSLDPRPAYHEDEERVYGMPFAGMDIRFRVKEDVLVVCEIVEDAY